MPDSDSAIQNHMETTGFLPVQFWLLTCELSLNTIISLPIVLFVTNKYPFFILSVKKNWRSDMILASKSKTLVMMYGMLINPHSTLESSRCCFLPLNPACSRERAYFVARSILCRHYFILSIPATMAI